MAGYCFCKRFLLSFSRVPAWCASAGLWTAPLSRAQPACSPPPAAGPEPCFLVTLASVTQLTLLFLFRERLALGVSGPCERLGAVHRPAAPCLPPLISAEAPCSPPRSQRGRGQRARGGGPQGRSLRLPVNSGRGELPGGLSVSLHQNTRSCFPPRWPRGCAPGVTDSLGRDLAKLDVLPAFHSAALLDAESVHAARCIDLIILRIEVSVNRGIGY